MVIMKQVGVDPTKSKQFEYIAKLTAKITKPRALKHKRSYGPQTRQRSISPEELLEPVSREKIMPLSRGIKVTKRKEELKLDLGSVLPAAPHVLSDRHRTDRYGLDNYYVVAVPTNCASLLPPVQGIPRKYIDDGFYTPAKSLTLKPTLYSQSPHVGPTPKALQEHDASRFSVGKEKSHSVYELRSIMTPWGVLDASEDEKQQVAEKRKQLVRQSAYDAGLTNPQSPTKLPYVNVEFRPRAKTPPKFEVDVTSTVKYVMAPVAHKEENAEVSMNYEEVEILHAELQMPFPGETDHSPQETKRLRNKQSLAVVAPVQKIAAKHKRNADTTEMIKKRKSIIEGKKSVGLGIAQDSYMTVYHFFDRVMGPTAVVNSSTLLHDTYNVLGQTVDLFLVRKMDMRKTGIIEFADMLRVFFPTSTESDIAQCIKLWGVPSHRKQVGKIDNSSWKDRFTPEQVKEIEEMYNLFWNGRPLTLSELRRHIPESSMSTELLEQTFNDCDQDNDGELSLEEFALSVESSFTSESIYRSSVGKRNAHRKPLVLHFSEQE